MRGLDAWLSRGLDRVDDDPPEIDDEERSLWASVEWELDREADQWRAVRLAEQEAEDHALGAWLELRDRMRGK